VDKVTCNFAIWRKFLLLDASNCFHIRWFPIFRNVHRHCKRFSSTYQLIAQNLHKKNKDKSKSKHIHVAKIEGSQERILSSRFSIRGYPTFFVVDGWDVYEFKGIRTLESLMNFVEKDYRKQEV